MQGRVAWLTAAEVMERLIPGVFEYDAEFRRRCDELRISSVPAEQAGEKLYRGMDIVHAFGVRGVCPVCLERCGDQRFCSEACAKRALEELRVRCAVVAAGLPAVVAVVPESMLADLRLHAQRNGLSMAESLRVALLVGTRAVVDRDQQ